MWLIYYGLLHVSGFNLFRICVNLSRMLGLGVGLGLIVSDQKQTLLLDPDTADGSHENDD
jgi:hypothetical protein